MSEQVWPLRLTVAPYVLLACLAAVTILIKRDQPGSLTVDLVLCALVALWILGMFTLRPARRTDDRAMAIFVTGFVVLLAVLVVRDPWFGFLTPAGYFYTFILLPWPGELLGVGAVAVLAGFAQAYDIPKTDVVGVLGSVAVIGVNVIGMCLAAWLGRRGEVLSQQRKDAVDALTETNRRLEASLAENAILHEQLLTQARDAGVIDERQRMAREIHDTLAQGLTGIVTQLQAAENASDWRRHVTTAIGLARESLTEARRSVHALRSQPLQSATLSGAIADVVRRWSAVHGVDVRLTTTGTPRVMTPEAESTLLRATQEALANVAKYAQASRVGVTLSYMEKKVALDVRDDGAGFDPARISSSEAGGFGLVAMRQRVEAMDGTLEIESEPGFGTAISATLPLTGRPA
ncbi:sensor histidine kinase [Kribbella sp. VKM Ac-2566]|uniref:sensor histidine kinase n=1 Tax=Kribbella sp. VKM Ac-2566 TaxID=2512218 RepID=UPI0010642676|nr:sensor histidine kinase [Kribbella sp. VKM Ac-2566]TDX08760.1 signal transduction histidine kinase [Kribbella sp. VKM Ac-2566]